MYKTDAMKCDVVCETDAMQWQAWQFQQFNYIVQWLIADHWILCTFSSN